MITAAAIGAKINDGGGHVTDAAPYVLNRMWGIGYFMETGPTSDGGNYVDVLDQQGYSSVTSTNLILLNAASSLLSGGFLALVKSTYVYLAHGDTAVSPLELDAGDLRVFWPEVTTWLNADNVSVSFLLETAWKSAAFFHLGVDAPVLGNTKGPPELTVGARTKVQVLGLGLELTTRFAGVPFVQGTVGLQLDEHVTVGLQGHYGQGNTMRELREYPLGPGPPRS